VSADLFRELFAGVAATAAIVAVTDEDGEPHGLACTAMCAVSADPPLLLVCIDKRSDTLPFIRAAGSFSLNVMSVGAEAAVSRLATKLPDKFAGVRWERSPEAGNPVLQDNLLGFADCRVVELVDAGDHVVLIGRIAAAVPGFGEPLIYYRRGFHQLDEQSMSDLSTRSPG
jgi:flavin-dependent trigonelline monooxygenase, reductase component